MFGGDKDVTRHRFQVWDGHLLGSIKHLVLVLSCTLFEGLCLGLADQLFHSYYYTDSGTYCLSFLSWKLGGKPFEGQEFCVPKTTIHLQSFLWILNWSWMLIWEMDQWDVLFQIPLILPSILGHICSYTKRGLPASVSYERLWSLL